MTGIALFALQIELLHLHFQLMHACCGTLQLRPRAVVLLRQAFHLRLEFVQAALRLIDQHILRAQLRLDLLNLLRTRQHPRLLGLGDVKTQGIA